MDAGGRILTTIDPLVSHGPSPALPNVRDLSGEVAILSRHLDILVIALARKGGVSEAIVREQYGLPAGNPWQSRRAVQNAPGGPVALAAALAPTYDI